MNTVEAHRSRRSMMHRSEWTFHRRARCRRRTPCLWVLAAATALAWTSSYGTPIDMRLDVMGTRTQLGLTQGLLSFQHSAPKFNGDERTGWIDVRHPAYYDDPANKDPEILTRDLRGFGYDRSDFHVDVNNVIVEDSTGKKGSSANIARDFDFANQAYASSLGITIHNQRISEAKYNNVTFPIAGFTTGYDPVNGDEFTNIRSANRHGTNTTVNSYYAGAFSPGEGLADTASPENGAANGFVMSNSASVNRDSWAHEMGHFLIDNHRFQSGADTSVHSPDANDLMATNAGGFRNKPSAALKESGNKAPSNPGPDVGNIGGVDQFDANMRIKGGKGAFNIPQIDAIYQPAKDPVNAGKVIEYVQIADNGFRFGDRVDFDWVEDNTVLEQAATNSTIADFPGDNHDGSDYMTWEIAAIANAAHTGHDHGDWLTGPEPEPGLARYMEDSFRLADVFSQTLRYTDMDVGAGSNWSARESALDYLIEFSADGSNWESGTALTVFKAGWTKRSLADDYVARWLSPLDAKFVRISSETTVDENDRNTQIDAIVVANLEKDYGDAPDSYRTLENSDGPRYQEGSLQRMGSRWDADPDGQPSARAIGDDLDLNLSDFDIGDDEDGVLFGEDYVIVSLDINRPGQNEYLLRAWWDVNDSGFFEHPNELFIDSVLLLDIGTYPIRFDLGFNPTDYFSRFRLTWDPLDWDVRPWGEFVSSDGLSHGEVEDYAPVPEPATLALLVLGLAGIGFRRLGGQV